MGGHSDQKIPMCFEESVEKNNSVFPKGSTHQPEQRLAPLN
jgi:hypothetical protein